MCTTISITAQSVLEYDVTGHHKLYRVINGTQVFFKEVPEGISAIPNVLPGEYELCAAKKDSQGVDCGTVNYTNTLEISGAAADDYETTTSGWLCNEGVTDTWIRTITPYVNGIAGTDITIDSGIDCTEDEPVTTTHDYEYIPNSTTGVYDLHIFTSIDGVLNSTPTIVPTTILIPSDTEIDGVASNWLPFCVDDVQWYEREYQTVDNADGSVLTTVQEYKEGIDGAITTTAPTGTTILEGYCSAPAGVVTPDTFQLGHDFTLTATPIDIATLLAQSGLGNSEVHSFEIEVDKDSADVILTQGAVSRTMRACAIEQRGGHDYEDGTLEAVDDFSLTGLVGAKVIIRWVEVA